MTTTRPAVAAAPGRFPWTASMPTATAGTRNVQAKTRALVQWLRAT